MKLNKLQKSFCVIKWQGTLNAIEGEVGSFDSDTVFIIYYVNWNTSVIYNFSMHPANELV